MILLNLLLGAVAFICFIFIVGEANPPISDNKRNQITIAFVVLVLFIIAVNTVF